MTAIGAAMALSRTSVDGRSSLGVCHTNAGGELGMREYTNHTISILELLSNTKVAIGIVTTMG